MLGHRSDKCKGTCDQLSLATAASRAHAASVLTDLGGALKSLVEHLFGADRARAELASGDTSASLYQARERGGVEASFLALGGTLRPSLQPPAIVAQGGGNIVAQGGGNIVAQGGGNIVASGAGNLAPKGGGGLISNKGAGIVAAGAGNVLAGGVTGIVAQGGGNVLAIGGRAVIAPANGVLPAGTIVAQGGGNQIPVLPSSLIGQDAASIVAQGGGN